MTCRPRQTGEILDTVQIRAGREVVVVTSGAIVAGRLLILRVVCGDLWGQGPEDEKVQARATELVSALEEQLSTAGFELRAGLFTDPEARS